jgi:hypothetical protein
MGSSDLDFNFDVLSYLASLPDYDLFRHVVIRSLPLVKEEDEFLELIHISIDILHSLDLHEKAESLEQLAGKRNASGPIAKDDPDLMQLEKILR